MKSRERATAKPLRSTESAKLILAAAVVLVLTGAVIGVGSANGELLTLQNDSFEPPGSVACQMGAVVGETLAARFTPAPGDYPFRVEEVAVLVCPDSEVGLFDLYVWHDDGASISPGALIYTDTYQVSGSDVALNVFNLSSENIVIDSGSIRIGFELLQSAPPSCATDLDGNITPQMNFVLIPPDWYFLEWFGSAGDWIIRLEIDTLGDEPIFVDGFESGNTDEWSLTVN